MTCTAMLVLSRLSKEVAWGVWEAWGRVDHWTDPFLTTELVGKGSPEPGAEYLRKDVASRSPLGAYALGATMLGNEPQEIYRRLYLLKEYKRLGSSWANSNPHWNHPHSNH